MVYNILNTCSIYPGNICQVVGGYAETFKDLVSNFPESYHRIPLGINLEVFFILKTIYIFTLKEIYELDKRKR